MSLATQIPIQAGNSLAYNPSEFFDVRDAKFKNVAGVEDKSMHNFGIGILLIVGIILLIKNK